MLNIQKLPQEPTPIEYSAGPRFEPEDMEAAVLRVIRELDKGKTIESVFENLGKRQDDPKNFKELVRANLIYFVRDALIKNGSIAPFDSDEKLHNPQNVFCELMKVPDMTNNLLEPAEEMSAEEFKSTIHSVRHLIEDQIRQAKWDHHHGY
jgi:hypothetical protein